MKKIRIVLIGACVALTSLVAGCGLEPETAHVEPIIDKDLLNHAQHEHQATLDSTVFIINTHQADFTDAEWAMIEAVRVETDAVHAKLNELIMGHVDIHPAVALNDYAVSLRNLRHQYHVAYLTLRPRFIKVSPALTRRIAGFGHSITRLENNYVNIRMGIGNQTELVIESLQIVAIGSRLFGVSVS